MLLGHLYTSTHISPGMLLMRTKMINSLALPGYHESGKAIFSDKRKPAEEAAQVLAVFHNSGGSGWWSSMDGGGRSKDPTDICPNDIRCWPFFQNILKYIKYDKTFEMVTRELLLYFCCFYVMAEPFLILQLNSYFKNLPLNTLLLFL